MSVGASPRKQTYERFAKQVEQSTARELTYEKDSLNAFIGVVNYYTDGQGSESFPLYTYMGLPCNPGFDTVTDFRAITHQFFRSLLWEHETSHNRGPPKRGQGCPSYSWAGWAGVATLPKIQTIFVDDSKTSLHARMDPGRSFEYAAPLSPTLDFNAYVIQGQVEFSEDLDSNGLHTSFHLTPLEKSPRQSILLPTDFLSRHNHSSGLQVFPVDCLLMGRSYGDIFHFMLIERHEEIAERIGVTFFQIEDEVLQSVITTRQRIRLR